MRRILPGLALALASACSNPPSTDHAVKAYTPRLHNMHVAGRYDAWVGVTGSYGTPLLDLSNVTSNEESCRAAGERASTAKAPFVACVRATLTVPRKGA